MVAEKLRLIEVSEACRIISLSRSFYATCTCTFVAVDKGFLHHDSPSIDSIDLFRLALAVSNIVAFKTCGPRNSKDMACQEILGPSQVRKCRISLSVFPGQEAFGGWNEENLKQCQLLVHGGLRYGSTALSLAGWYTYMVVDWIALGR